MGESKGQRSGQALGLLPPCMPKGEQPINQKARHRMVCQAACVLLAAALVKLVVAACPHRHSSARANRLGSVGLARDLMAASTCVCHTACRWIQQQLQEVTCVNSCLAQGASVEGS